MAKKQLEKIVKSTWAPIYDAIINSRKRISTIKREYRLKNGLLCEYCIKATGYDPEELRVFEKISNITDKLISGKSIASVKKYYNVGATAFTKIFRELYGMPATQYLIDYQARQGTDCRLFPSDRAKVRGDISKKHNKYGKVDRYKVRFSNSKVLLDDDM